jgi:hypothetical protein
MKLVSWWVTFTASWSASRGSATALEPVQCQCECIYD